MAKTDLVEVLQQDIKDLGGILLYQEYGLNAQQVKNLSRGIVMNLEDHLEELIGQI